MKTLLTPTTTFHLFFTKEILTIAIWLCTTMACCQHVKIYTQTDVDSFAINYPDLLEISSLDIYGESIVNLHGLNQIERVDESISIRYTSLNNLNGLENIEVLDGNNANFNDLLIYGNQLLETIEALSNLNYDNEDGTIIVVDNPNLSMCSTQFLCNHIINHRWIAIFGNAENCSQRNDFELNCDLHYNTGNKELIYYNDFETWEGSLPTGFELLFEDNNILMYSVKKVQALSEGDYALSISNNYNSLDSYEPVYILSTFPGIKERINVEFDCQCKGEGICEIFIIESQEAQDNKYIRPVWLISSQDTSTYSFKFQDITHTSNLSEIRGIGYKISSDDSFSQNIGEFVIDDLKIYADNPTNTVDEKSTLHFYPNPTNGLLHMSNSTVIDKIRIYNSNGEVIMETEEKSIINLSNFPPGPYYFSFRSLNTIQSIKIIKQ